MEKGAEFWNNSYELSKQKTSLEKPQSKLRAMTQTAIAFLLTSCATNVSKNDIPSNFETINQKESIQSIQSKTNTTVSNILTAKQSDAKEDIEQLVNNKYTYTVEHLYEPYGQDNSWKVDESAWLGNIREVNPWEFVIKINTYSVELMEQYYDVPREYAENVVFNNEFWSGEYQAIFHELKISHESIDAQDYYSIWELAWDIQVITKMVEWVDNIAEDDTYAIREKIQELRAGLLFYYTHLSDADTAQNTPQYQLWIKLMNSNFKEVFGASMSPKNLKNMLDNLLYISQRDQYATLQQFQDFSQKMQKSYNEVLQSILYEDEFVQYQNFKNNENLLTEKSYEDNSYYAQNY